MKGKETEGGKGGGREGRGGEGREREDTAPPQWKFLATPLSRRLEGYRLMTSCWLLPSNLLEADALV
jgi:hypothetical protein